MIPEIESLKQEYATQDNRATAYPIYVTVQEFIQVGIMAEGYSPIGLDSEIVNEHSCEGCDQKCDPEPEHCDQDMPIGYMWLDIEFFLTIKGAEEYMKANAHNHGKLRTYVNHFERRNFEMRGLLEALGFKVKD